MVFYLVVALGQQAARAGQEEKLLAGLALEPQQEDWSLPAV
jgi:hypothetical protein